MATIITSPASDIDEPTLSKVVSTITTTSIPSASTPPPTTTPPTLSWQTGPIPLISTTFAETAATDQYTAAATEMALVHNCIIRSLNTIYHQSAHIPTHEQTNFLCYALATYNGLCAHHDGEETHFFPTIERLTGEKGLMDDNVQGHRDFDTAFTAWGTWLKACLSHTHPFSSARNIQLMDSFIPPLSTHLHDEIPSLLALSRFGDALDLRALMKQEGDHVMGSMDKKAVLPIFFFNHDVAFEGGVHNFPPLPAPVKWVLVNLFGRWNAAWWKFAACGGDGRARECRFLGSE